MHVGKALIAATLVGGLAMPAAGSELAYGLLVGPSSNVIVHGVQPFVDDLRKATDGKVDFKLHAGGSLVSAKTALTGLRNGLVDAALVAPAYVPSEVPNNAIFADLSFLGKDPYVMMAAVTETFLLDCANCVQEYTRLRVQPFGMFAATPYHLMCKQPASSLKELEGRKVSVPTGALADWVRHIGLVAINLPTVEIRDALDRGQADCVVSTVAWLDTYDLYGLVTTVFDMPMGLAFSSQPFMMNKRSWDRMEAPEKQAIIDHVPGLLVNITKSYLDMDIQAAEKGKARGVKWVKAPEDMQKAYETYTNKHVTDAIKAGQKRGVTQTPETVASLERNVDKWQGLLAQADGDPEKIRQLMREHVYSKLDK